MSAKKRLNISRRERESERGWQGFNGKRGVRDDERVSLKVLNNLNLKP